VRKPERVSRIFLKTLRLSKDLCATAVLLALRGMAMAEPWSPPVYGIERYAHIWESSPFVVATELAPISPGLADRYIVTGYAQLDGKATVFLFDRSTMSRLTIRTGEETNGVKLLSISKPENLKSCVAIISAGGQIGNIKYDSAPDQASPAVANASAPGESPPPRGVEPPPRSAVKPGPRPPSLPRRVITRASSVTVPK